MALFNYKAIDASGAAKEGSIEATNVDVAINSLQRRGLIISGIKSTEKGENFLDRSLLFLNRVKTKEVVILSRQMAVLFEAQVSALRVFRLLSSESENPKLQKILTAVSDDLQGGSSISNALAKHPNAFSPFYVSMVRAGEESGKLDEIFVYLADYLDRTYEVTSKARNALIYPAFVITTFITVMILMLTIVIPKIKDILTESGQELPIYTKIVLGISNFFVDYGIFFLVFVIFAGFILWKFGQNERGKMSYSRFKILLPYVGTLYRKLYLSRIADNMNTMLISGIPMLKALEITADVVDSEVYKKIILESVDTVKSGTAVSEALSKYPEIPGIMIQMIKIGEETGELGEILKTLAKFYRREVENAVDTLVDLIEPVMIVSLGLGVGVLLLSVLMPIYNVTSGL